MVYHTKPFNRPVFQYYVQHNRPSKCPPLQVTRIISAISECSSCILFQIIAFLIEMFWHIIDLVAETSMDVCFGNNIEESGLLKGFV